MEESSVARNSSLLLFAYIKCYYIDNTGKFSLLSCSWNKNIETIELVWHIFIHQFFTRYSAFFILICFSFLSSCVRRQKRSSWSHHERKGTTWEFSSSGNGVAHPTQYEFTKQPNLPKLGYVVVDVFKLCFVMCSSKFWVSRKMGNHVSIRFSYKEAIPILWSILVQ